jgi:hypothetical protein
MKLTTHEQKVLDQADKLWDEFNKKAYGDNTAPNKTAPNWWEGCKYYGPKLT